MADAAQLEPRILTGLSGDEAMAAAGRGKDLYEGIVASGAVDERAHAKVAMLGAMYGATTGESGRLMPRLTRAWTHLSRQRGKGAMGGEGETQLEQDRRIVRDVHPPAPEVLARRDRLPPRRAPLLALGRVEAREGLRGRARPTQHAHPDAEVVRRDEVAPRR